MPNWVVLIAVLALVGAGAVVAYYVIKDLREERKDREL